MMLCLVTNRRRLGAAAGVGAEKWEELLEQQVRAAAGAGVEMVQVRESDLDGFALTTLVRRLVHACAGTRTRVLVNDRLDVAIAAGAAGVQLKERSFPPDEARRIAPPEFLIGCSVHSIAAASARRSADFLIAGTVLPTASKPTADYLEWEGLQQIVNAAGGTPVMGIGGLDVSSIPLLAKSCAVGLAGIGVFIPGPGEAMNELIRKRVSEMRFAFDSVGGVP
jgi:thiamine-phosphate pyrophosphorylase